MKRVVNINWADMTDERLALIKASGFEGVDLDCERFSDEEIADFPRLAESIRARLDAAGLECAQVHLPCHDLFLSSEIVDERVDRHMKAVLSSMDVLGARWGAYHPRSSKNTGYDPKQAFRDNIAEIGRYLEVADKHSVGIAVENLPVFPDCPQYRFYSADYEDHIALVDGLNSANAGICLDVGHLNLTLYDMEKVIERMGQRIKILHVHNNFRYCDMHITPAEGTIDWGKVMPALKRAGYEGNVSLEINFGGNFALPETLPSLMAHLADSAGALIKRFNG